MTTEKVLHGLRDGKLHVHEATLAQDHDKKAQSPTSGSDVDHTVFAPIHLSTFAGLERQKSKRPVDALAEPIAHSP